MTSIKSLKNMEEQNTENFFNPIDAHFARLMQKLSGQPGTGLALAAALVSRATGNGAACLDLSTVAAKALPDMDHGDAEILCPPIETWLEAIAHSPVVGKPGDYRPLILDDQKCLYLLRYFQYEQNLAESIHRLANTRFDLKHIDHSQKELDGLLGGSDQVSAPMQIMAVLTALLHGFTLVTGGPGTGKTYTIARIIAALMLLEEITPQRILLAAPTGKAAARLGQAMADAQRAFKSNAHLKLALPVQAVTIHRLLKARADGGSFVHDAHNPLTADVVVVDEASMVDLALMARLVAALPEGARLILAGDKDQLVSVESGSVLSDICHKKTVHRFSENFLKRIKKNTGYAFEPDENFSETSPIQHPLQDCIVVLTEGHRFGSQSAIDRLRKAVNCGDAGKALSILETAPAAKVAWEKDWPSAQSVKSLEKNLLNGYRPYLQTGDPHEALQRFLKFQVLCAVNFGSSGVSAINHLAESILSGAGLIKTNASPWYRGRPVMITRNDHRQGLFNGDIGITLPASDSNGGLQVYFSTSQGGLKPFWPQRLPEHQTVFAMTVHKSQGSEFSEVMLVLPEKDFPVLSRELIYTGLTRARNKLKLWSSTEIFTAAVNRRIVRSSGLSHKLWLNER
jgi:exodeoxyribonuclease V alpha subunit